ncbi:tetratricopeptide repeat protein [Polluticoccus soli]|uniref:tetratricopeptide repeat protein n=1 Tax=Polluticoccus soli TaxID=3034150 RepID=UPI0023E1E66F|nr:hypothetical protein [Flavipsychrobacter sp. JY13-12]
MKKFIVTAVCLAAGFSAMAQKINIQNALNSQSDKELDKALEFIEKAAADPSTKDNPKTWYVRGSILLDMQNDPKYKASQPLSKATESFVKVVELDPKYEKETVGKALRGIAFSNYNNLVDAYNAKKYEDALASSKEVARIHELDGGKKYAADKYFDTIATNAKLFGAYSAVNANKTDEALPVLLSLKGNPIIQTPNVYLALIDIYKKQGKESEVIALIEEGRKAYPNNKALEVEELTYYTRTGKQDEFLRKLEDAAAKDPSNANYLANIATAYTNMAFPKDAQGKALPKPANYDDLIAKANVAYTNLLKAAPNSADYNFNAGVFYFNQASEYISAMNKIDGNTAADKKKIDELSAKTNAAFEQSAQYFEKAYMQLEPKLASLSSDDKSTYWSSLSALKQVYTRQNKMDKANEMKAKMDAMKK